MSGEFTRFCKVSELPPESKKAAKLNNTWVLVCHTDGRLFAVSEAYPDLKASANFASLQEELASTENKIGFARQFYNETVMNLNNKVQMFPGNIIAGMFRFGTETFFEVKDEAQREAPKVSFN